MANINQGLNFPTYPYTDSVEPFIVRDWFRQFKDYLITKKVVSGNLIIAGGGGITFADLPTGWTIARTAAGSYTVTHNLNFPVNPGGFAYPYTVIGGADVVGVGVTTLAGTNTINFSRFLTTTGALQDGNFSFVMLNHL
jgi:hypothetical protein